MKNIPVAIPFLAALQILSLSSLVAQKHFNVTVQLPKRINIEKVETWLEYGKHVKQIAPQIKNGNELILTGDYFSTYAAVKLQYMVDPPNRTFPNTFFVQDQPAVIKIDPPDSAEYPFGKYSLKNALDFNKEKKEMQDYVSAEQKQALNHYYQYGMQILGPDTAIRNSQTRLDNAVKLKELQFIKDHLDSYYSFYCFREDLAASRAVSPDTLLMVFNSFPEQFKYSDEGNYVNQFLHGTQLAKNKGEAIDFTTRDIHNNKVTLSDFKGKKLVLLHFWGAWCTPCMKELPAIKEINEEFKSKGLQIISIALPPKHTEYLATIKRLPMNWINVYNDDALQNKYGRQTTPRLCLIDKTGKVIYDSIGVENDDFKLTGLKEVLNKITAD